MQKGKYYLFLSGMVGLGLTYPGETAKTEYKHSTQLTDMIN